jgi:diapolycopene oxygenase
MTGNGADRVAVVGGGLGGLAAACTLAARGHSVVVFERNPWLGGKAAILRDSGFRFDMGPTILTMPGVLRKIFAEAGRDLDDYLDLVRLDPQWRCFFPDRSSLDLHADEGRMVAASEEWAPGSSAGYREFIDFARRMHNVADRNFFWRSVGSMTDIVRKRSAGVGRLARDLVEMRPGRSVAHTVRHHVRDHRLAQVLDHFTQYVGSDPHFAPAILCGIAHMQTDEGVWYPRGGTGAVPAALAKLAGELGVDVRTGVGVQSIRFGADRRANGVVLEDGSVEPCHAVVSNADSVRTFRELLGDETRLKQFKPACSGVVLYLGLDRQYEALLHHNFVFSDDPAAEAETVFEKGELANDPTCYVCAPARTDRDCAPTGGEALYVLVHAPYLRPHHDWNALFPAYRRVILDKLARTAGLTDLEKHIRIEHRLTPADIDRRYSVLNGAIYGLASHGKFRGALKPANRLMAAQGLYLAGGSAHPGPGMPMVLMSGWIAAHELDRDVSRVG